MTNSQHKVIGIKELIADPYSAVGKLFHYEDEMMAPEGPAGEALAEMVDYLSGGAADIISVDGLIVFTDGYSAMVRVSHYFLEYEHYLFSYDELKSNYSTFEDKDATRTSRYIWVSLLSEWLIPNDPNYFSNDYVESEPESEEMPEEVQEAVFKLYEVFKFRK